MDDVITRRVVVSGAVQGVGFRFWTRSTARRMGLEGWVRNLHDGRVEILLSGPVEAVDRMTELCRKGPPHALVSSLDYGPSAEDPPHGFEVRV